MKKLLIVILALFIAAGISAQEGLYFGLEFGIDDFSDAGGTIFTVPYLGYSHTFFESLELGAELTFPIVSESSFGFGFGIEPFISYGIGIFYFGLAFPMQIYEDPFSEVGMDFFIGTEFECGFGMEAKLYNYINYGDSPSFFDSLDIYAFYGMESLSFGLCASFPLKQAGFDSNGITITPDISFYISENFNIYAELPIFGIGKTIGAGLLLGLCYSF